MRSSVGHFLSQQGWAQPTVGGAVPELEALGSIRKLAEQPGEAALHGLCISSWPRDPVLCEFLVLTSFNEISAVEVQAK